MKCKHCKNDIPDELHFTFCGYCGERLIPERKKKDAIKIPKARLRGKKWYIELRREGVTVIEDTEAEAIAKATAIRAGIIEVVNKHKLLTLRNAIDNYIEDRNNILSPSTLRGYRSIQRNAFPYIMDKDLTSVANWQSEINKELKRVSPKTLKNEWGLVKAVLDDAKIDYDVSLLPQPSAKTRNWFDYEQIKIFLAAVQGESCEMAALFALHSLRRSEIWALTPADIVDGYIHVDGSAVFDEHNKLVAKPTNKTVKSKRVIPIMIPRLNELLKNYGGKADEPFFASSSDALRQQINRVCTSCGLPEVGIQGLRRSFASLAYHLKWSERQTMLVGGWSNIGTIHKHYIDISETEISTDIQKMKAFYSD